MCERMRCEKWTYQSEEIQRLDVGTLVGRGEDPRAETALFDLESESDAIVEAEQQANGGGR